MPVEKKWQILFIAVVAEVLAEAIWFSYAPFTSQISNEFGLTVASIGLLASASVWITPPGRVFSGLIADRYGAENVFSLFLLVIGVFSILSSFVQSYQLLFITRIFAALGGVTVIVGIQHLSQWFSDEHYGLAEGVYAGAGTAGGALSLLVLPQVFGDWSGSLFKTGWRAAFFYLGFLAIITAVIYYLFTEDAPDSGQAEKAAQNATLKGLLYTATRFTAIALALGYIMSIGVVSAMNFWLPTYFQRFFSSNMAMAGILAAIVPVTHAIIRPVSGHVSDYLHRKERNILPILAGKFREQWAILSMSIVVLSMVGLTMAGQSGGITYVLLVLGVLGLSTGLVGGSVFAIVPEIFPERSGAASGIIGGTGTMGGVLFPVIFAWTAQGGTPHIGYSIAAMTLLPIVLLNIYVFHPSTGFREEKGLLDLSS